MPTDEQTQYTLTGAVTMIQVAPDTTIQWKIADGTFVTLPGPELVMLAQAVATHVQNVDTETAADTYFEVARLEEREVTDYSTQVRVPKTRAGVVALMEEHGFVETDIDRAAVQTSADALTDLENLAFKHEIRREAIVRELERRRKKRNKQLMRPTRD